MNIVNEIEIVPYTNYWLTYSFFLGDSLLNY